MSKTKLALIFGGNSPEHEVSKLSAVSILRNLSSEKYDIFIVGITKQGKWYLYSGDPASIMDDSWENNSNNKVAFISPDASSKGLIVLEENSYRYIEIDVVLPIIHGRTGEDGQLQGLLGISGIPFVGSETTASAACMDKVITNTLLKHNNINKPNFYWFYTHSFKENSSNILNECEKIIGSYPMFVKPACCGSSVGVSKANNRDELIVSIELALKEDRKIVVEECISGQEVECAVIGNTFLQASIVGEIVPGSLFYDYNDKYINDAAKLYIPARIPESVSDEVRSASLRAYSIMGCKGLSRVDFLIQKDTNKVFLNEINTLPGFTSISMYPKLMEQIGLDFPKLIDKLIELALDKE